MAETKATKKQATAGQEKVQKIAKFALLSPFLTYADVVPSKPAKDMFSALQKHLLEMAKELSPTESAQKRQKNDVSSHTPQFSVQQSDLKSLKQNKQLAIGAKDVIKGLSCKCIVFIVNIAETAAITKHMISICRASSIPHVVLPKFQHEALCKLLGVKRLTCFSLIGEQQEEKVPKQNVWWVDLENPNDSDLIQKVKEFNNAKTSISIDDYKNGTEYMFKPCSVKRWVVYKRTAAKTADTK